MGLRVLGLSASPRAEGNSDLLLREALSGAQAAGAETEYVALRELNIAPCQECGACHKLGTCRFDDDFQIVFQKMLQADRLVFATPVFFMGVCTQGKLLIDRCQCLWARKYVLKQPLFSDGTRDRRAMVIAVGGSKSTDMFASIRLTMKYYLDSLEMKLAAALFVNQIDARGAIRKHPTAMREASRLGRKLVSLTTPPDKPERVELFDGLS